MWLLRWLFASWLGISLSVGVVKDCLSITWWFTFPIFPSFIKLFISASKFCFCCSSLLILLGWKRDKGSKQLHRHLAAEWGQPTAPFKPFTRFLAAIYTLRLLHLSVRLLQHVPFWTTEKIKQINLCDVLCHVIGGILKFKIKWKCISCYCWNLNQLI